MISVSKECSELPEKASTGDAIAWTGACQLRECERLGTQGQAALHVTEQESFHGCIPVSTILRRSFVKLRGGPRQNRLPSEKQPSGRLRLRVDDPPIGSLRWCFSRRVPSPVPGRQFRAAGR